MDLTLKFDISDLPEPIRYTDKILLMGSCFTEHISERLKRYKFHTLANPHGILFNPLSVVNALNSYVEGKQYERDELFFLNELWNSWAHHTRFSDTDQNEVLQKINKAQQAAIKFIREADWIIITLGSAFQYYLKRDRRLVANNHRAPVQWFERELLPTAMITDALHEAIEEIFEVNSKIKLLFTVSPVRHVREGIVENNRSKARLIETVHQLCDTLPSVHYFPAYELVIDVLRDYRFYDIDLAHPNYLATNFVWEKFADHCIANSEREIMNAVHDVMMARAHKPRFLNTRAYGSFKKKYQEKIKELAGNHPFLDLEEELSYFSA